MKIKTLGKLGVWRSVASVSSMILILSIGGTLVTNEWSGYINKMLNINNTKIVTDENANEDPIHFKSSFTSYKDVMKNAREKAKQVQLEGTVLMENKNNALPLNQGAKVTFLSYSSAEVLYGSSGSGGITPEGGRLQDLITACQNDNKLDMNMTAYNFYKEKYDNKVGFTESKGWGGTTMKFRNLKKATEIAASEFTTEMTNSFSSYNDAAIFILSRTGGEGSDLSAGTDKYLAITDEEKSVLQAMKDGPFKKRIVLVNTFNAVELGFLDEYNIDACLYIGGTGEVGLDAVTDILVGKACPSGKLADTYAYDSYSSPAMQNFGDYTFSNKDDILNPDSRKYVMYNEGIYVGYRYYETRYEDYVLNRGNANSSAGSYVDATWNYAKEVQFPFGYGLSYANLSQELISSNVDWNTKKATFTVKVTNESSFDAIDTVEVYAQAPYITGGLEKSSVQLCGFTKVDVKANSSINTTVEVELKDIATYDAKTYKTYIMDKGDYYFAIGNGAHDALNNILEKKGLTSEQKALMVGQGNSKNAVLSTKTTFNPEEYMASQTATKTKITNQFDEVDVNNYLSEDQKITYLSRSDWNKTWPKSMTNFVASQKMINVANSYYSSDNKGTGTLPSAYTKETDGEKVTLGAEKKYTLAMMIGASYDDPNWDLLLDQLTKQDYLDSTSQGRKPLASVGLPATTAVDGPAAWTKSNYIEDYTVQYDAEKVKKTTELTVLYPTETVMAGTWNVPLINEIGKSFGEEGLWGGGVGWYGPGANTHRTPYAGRNFEYFSEDGFIAGKLCEAEVHGAMKKGTIPYLKHFFLNDQETNRIGVCTFSNEQAIREIYLRAFQYSFETTGENDKSCSGVMGAFNRLGMVWSGHYSNLWKNVMEKEFGFLGNVTTDFGQKQGSLMEPQLAYEAGTHMFCTSGTGFATYLENINFTEDTKLMNNMREALHRQLYNFANSAAMNGMTSSSKIVVVRVWYENALTATTVVSSIVFAFSLGLMLIGAFTPNKKEEE